jgi:hypothetical protein
MRQCAPGTQMVTVSGAIARELGIDWRKVKRILDQTA